jgi:hypothetical protein
MNPESELARKMQRVVSEAGAIAIARGLSVDEAVRFVGEALLDSKDPHIVAYVQWILNDSGQHRRDN